MKDLRSPLAKKRDQWMESVEGLCCTSSQILRGPSLRFQLIQRIEAAFLAGAKAQEQLSKRKHLTKKEPK